MPAYAADAIAARKAAVKQMHEDQYRADLDRRCFALGLTMAEVEKRIENGPDLIRKAMRDAVASIPRHVLEARYPCAACKVISDDTYRAKCAAAKTAPCFVRVRLKGCPFIKPRLIVAKYLPPTRAAKK
jgi:hypothetical protein